MALAAGAGCERLRRRSRSSARCIRRTGLRQGVGGRRDRRDSDASPHARRRLAAARAHRTGALHPRRAACLGRRRCARAATRLGALAFARYADRSWFLPGRRVAAGRRGDPPAGRSRRGGGAAGRDAARTHYFALVTAEPRSAVGAGCLPHRARALQSVRPASDYRRAVGTRAGRAGSRAATARGCANVKAKPP